MKHENTLKTQYSGYLFVYFAGEDNEDGEQVYFAISRDGLNWKDLNSNKPILISKLGEKGIRDPFIIRSIDGEKFYIIATDLKINGNWDWKRAVTSGSKCIIIWESLDLLNWSEARRIQISKEDAGCTWAPEAIYDTLKDEYFLYWASTVGEDDFQKHRVYCAKTKDFRVFTPPEIYIEGEKHILDTTIIECNDIFYRYSNDDTYGSIVADCVEKLSDRNAKRIPAPVLEAQKGVEGPFVFKFHGENKWCLLVDGNGGRGYYPLITTDLSSGGFTIPLDGYKMPTRARHGSVISITDLEYESLVNKWNLDITLT